MPSKIVLPIVFLFIVFFTSIPLYGWPMMADEEVPDAAASTAKQEKLRDATAPAATGSAEGSSDLAPRGDGSRLPQEPVVQQEVEQPLDFSKMSKMQFVNQEKMVEWVQAEVAGDMKAQKEILDAAMQSMISKIPLGARMNSADLRKKLTAELKFRTVQAGGVSKMIESSADSIVLPPRIVRSPRGGVKYTKLPLVASPSAFGGEAQISAPIIPAIVAHDAKQTQQKIKKPVLLREDSSVSEYGELENESPNALFDNGGLGLVITVEENESTSDFKKMPVGSSLRRRVSSRLIMSPSVLDEKKLIPSGSVPPRPEFGLYTIRELRRNFSRIVGEELEVPDAIPAIVAHDAKEIQEEAGQPAPLNRGDSSGTDYGEIENEEFDGSGDVIVEVPSELTHDGKSCSLRIAFLKDQRAPSQRNLAREASWNAAVRKTEIDEDYLIAAAKEELTSAEPVVTTTQAESVAVPEPIAAPEPITRPSAERYQKLSPEQQSRLNDGKIVVTETKGRPYKSYGMTYYEPSTFTAYYILDADERHATVVYLNPARATKILPMCAEVEITKSAPASATANYIFQVDADLPLLGKQTFQDVVSMKSDRTFIEGQGDKISFETTAPSNYVKTFKGSFTVVPHEDKVLAAYEVTAEFQGLAGKFINSDAMENVVYGILFNIIKVVRE